MATESAMSATTIAGEGMRRRRIILDMTTSVFVALAPTVIGPHHAAQEGDVRPRLAAAPNAAAPEGARPVPAVSAFRVFAPRPSPVPGGESESGGAASVT